jgi:hypothetical protein
MRRRIAAIAAGSALVLGALGNLTPSSAAVLCPPGCVITGTTKTIGIFPSDGQATINGTLTVLASTRRGAIADAVSVGETYYVYISGTVASDANGLLSGTALLHVSSYTGAGYDSVGGYVQVSGTPQAVRLSGTNIEATLVSDGTGYTGPVIAYG